jgi:exopolysaccharide production protein ExoQ
MIRPIAALACVTLVGYLFWDDIRKRPGYRPSWAPLAWMFLAGSRWASSWLSLSTPISSVDSYSEGSPVDRAVFFGLIVWGLVVLARRNINWGRLLAKNAWLALYLLFCLASVMWTDEPVVLIKRWIKDLGNPIMALVILTEPRPYEALGVLLRRLSFLLLPLSVVFVRYYPELGRVHHVDGTPMYTGVGHQKNDLGLMCLVTGLYFFWKLLQRRDRAPAAERIDRWDVLLIAMLAWLLYMSNSQTSLACLVVAVLVMGVARLPLLSGRPRRLVPSVVAGGIAFATLEATIGMKDRILELLGRDVSLTNRTELWDVVLGHVTNPVLGAGFMSFWTGERMAAIWDGMGTAGINQAHSGYIEQYVNLGYVGLGLILLLLISTLFKIWKHSPSQPQTAILRLCIVVVAVLYNYTEASFYGINNMWLLLLASSLDVSGQPARPTATPRQGWADDEEPRRRVARPRRPSLAVRAGVRRGLRDATRARRIRRACPAQ